MEHLPSDVQSIVYKYLHKSKWECVTSEYYERIGQYWDDNYLRFYDKYVNDLTAMLRNYRMNLEYSSDPSKPPIPPIFNIFRNPTSHIQIKHN